MAACQNIRATRKRAIEKQGTKTIVPMDNFPVSAAVGRNAWKAIGVAVRVMSLSARGSASSGYLPRLQTVSQASLMLSIRRNQKLNVFKMRVNEYMIVMPQRIKKEVMNVALRDTEISK